jgi:hypothetical protein
MSKNSKHINFHSSSDESTFINFYSSRTSKCSRASVSVGKFIAGQRCAVLAGDSGQEENFRSSPQPAKLQVPRLHNPRSEANRFSKVEVRGS